MSAWLRFLLGLEPDEIPSGGDAAWELSGLPQGSLRLLAIAIVAAAVALVVVLYRRERVLGLGQRLVLSGLRLGALALVLLVLLNPRLITELHYTRPGRTLVLVDVSQSMRQRDTHEGSEVAALEHASGLALDERPARLDLARAALERAELLEKLGRRNRVELFAFAEDLVPIAGLETLAGPGAPAAASALTSAAPDGQAPAPAPLSLHGRETRLGECLAAALSGAGDEPVAAALLVSDGRQNAGGQALRLLEATPAAAEVPLHTIAVGRAQELRNYSVRDLSAPPAVELGYPLQVDAVVRLSGIRGPVRATLHRQGDGGGASKDQRLVEERVLESGGGEIETRLKFLDTLERKGVYRYTLELAPHPDEVNEKDNRRAVRVTATEEQSRLLLVAGAPTPEFRHLRKFALRDPAIQLSCWLQSIDPGAPQDGDLVLQRLPQTRNELGAYDVVVLLDPAPDRLGSEFQRALADFVSEDGGGVVYVAGESFTQVLAAPARAAEPLRKLLPVELGAPPAAARGAVFARPWRPAPTAAGWSHSLCRLEDEEADNRRLWSAVPPFYWLYAAAQLRPAAVALLAGGPGGRSREAGGGAIVAALQQAGLGEVLYLGSDDFWRLGDARETLREHFWAGVLRYLAQGKARAGTREATVETDRDRYFEGERVRIFLQVREATAGGGGSAGAPPFHEVTIARRDSAGETPTPPLKVRLHPQAGAAQRYLGFFHAEHEAEYAIEFDGKEKTSFKVQPASGELENPAPDFNLLEELAARRGGSFRRLYELDGLAEAIPDASVREVVGRRAATVWDSAALMVLFCALLVAEWTLRKLWHLN